ncbi:MAG: heparinase II/III family protein, partial [Armatimonadota bacterium]|nr:heparinase II/III family protein [Armatimonadota bacterium]
MHPASLLVWLAGPMPGPGYPVAPVPAGHPRVYVRPADLPALRAKLAGTEFRKEWEQLRQSRQPLCKAFVYLVTGDGEAGRAAIAEGFRALKENPDGRPFYNPMHFGACIYDWCYDLLTPEEKSAFVREFQRFAGTHSPGYPPNPNRVNPVVGHDCEGWILTNQLPAGVAIYDEAPEMYQAAARVFFDRFVEPRNFHYPSHMHHQGTHYNGERFIHDQAASWLFRKLGAGDVLSREQQFVPYHLLYMLRPDGKFLKSGDDNDDGGQSFNKRLAARLTGAYYRDPYLLTFSDRPQFAAPDYTAVFDLLFLDAGARRAPLSDLPLVHWFGSPMGEIVARTGWEMGTESRDALVQMRIGEYYFGNHQHRDFGTFQVYYRGPLAIDTGIYQGQEIESSDYGSAHWSQYYTQTVAHNGLMIFDPATAQQDYGGQRSMPSDHPRSVQQLKEGGYRWAEVTAHGYGPDPRKPAYAFVAGDITNAYLPTKAARVARAMAMLYTGSSRYPCVLAV